MCVPNLVRLSLNMFNLLSFLGGNTLKFCKYIIACAQLRLLRIFKLAKTWRTMRLLLKVIIKTLSSVINVTIVLVILLYVCAVMGYQLFAGTYNTRWNFNDFFHAFFLVFRIVSAADCVQPLYDCLPANGLNCLGIFLPALYLGSFVVSPTRDMRPCVYVTHY
jgi:sterol desaturase/sphingolipid hydroxylase (fatty acid hydroxylase superfamily)